MAWRGSQRCGSGAPAKATPEHVRGSDRPHPLQRENARPRGESSGVEWPPAGPCSRCERFQRRAIEGTRSASLHKQLGDAVLSAPVLAIRATRRVARAPRRGVSLLARGREVSGTRPALRVGLAAARSAPRPGDHGGAEHRARGSRGTPGDAPAAAGVGGAEPHLPLFASRLFTWSDPNPARKTAMNAGSVSILRS